MTDSINDQAYKNIQNTKIYATADNNGGQDEKIDFFEAKTQSGSIFDKGKSPIGDKVEEKIKASGKFADTEVGQAKSLVQKYLGNISLSAVFQNKYSEISYNSIDVKDGDNSADAQNKLDAAINQQIKTNLMNVQNSMEQEYSKALEHALKQAENEMKGDADIKTNGNVTGKTKDFHKKLGDIKYERSTNGSYQNIATFSGASGADKVSKGYENTVQFLEANGAKAFEREVNGQKQKIFVFKDENGNKQRVVVDDAGQIHNLETTTKRGKNTYVTSDEKEAATKFVQDKGATDVQVKRRKVDGQYQSVVMYKDANGNKQARVIDHNEVNGRSSLSGELTHVSAGGRAKYASSTSGLSSYVNSHDDAEFKEGKVKDGTWTDSDGKVNDNFKMSQHGRGKLDQKGVQGSIDSLSSFWKSKGANIQDDENSATVMVNGHTYTIDKTDYRQADRTIRLIHQEVSSMPTLKKADSTKLNITYTEDTRTDANTVEQNEASTSGKTGVAWGVGEYRHKSMSGEVHSLKGHYTQEFSKAKFQQEGWYSDRNRVKENEYITKMDNMADSSKGIKHARNLSTSTEFAQRFIEANFSDKLNGLTQGQKANVYAKLGEAIKTYNPSLFDSSGNMYKNADFARLNLPTNINKYIADKDVAASAPTSAQPKAEPKIDVKVETAPAADNKPTVNNRPNVHQQGDGNKTNVEEYLANDSTYQGYVKYFDDMKNTIQSIEQQYGITKDDNLLGVFKIPENQRGNYSEMAMLYKMDAPKLNEYKQVMENWQDGPLGEKSFVNRNGKMWTNLERITLTNGQRAWKSDQGFYMPYLDGGIGGVEIKDLSLIPDKYKN